MQICRIFDMGYKEVIELRSGARLGYVYDAEIDMETGQVKALLGAGESPPVWPAGPGRGRGDPLGCH